MDEKASPFPEAGNTHFGIMSSNPHQNFTMTGLHSLHHSTDCCLDLIGHSYPEDVVGGTTPTAVLFPRIPLVGFPSSSSKDNSQYLKPSSTTRDPVSATKQAQTASLPHEPDNTLAFSLLSIAHDRIIKPLTSTEGKSGGLVLGEEMTAPSLASHVPDPVSHLPEVDMAQLRLMRFTPLTTTQRQTVSDIINGPANDDVIIDKFQTAMTRTKMKCLLPEIWLNDEVSKSLTTWGKLCGPCNDSLALSLDINFDFYLMTNPVSR